MHSRFLKQNLFLLWLFSLTQVTFAESFEDQDYDEFLSYVSQLNRYSPLETAGSHGSFGTHLGIGMSSNPVDHENSYSSTFQNNGDESRAENINLTKFYFLKGTPLPIDVGLSAGSILGSKITQASGHIQWSVIEGFQLPSIALRGHFGRMFGHELIDFETYGGDVLASYGVFNYVSVYAGYGLQRNIAEIREIQSPSRVRKDTEFLTSSQIIGLRIAILPPFFAATAEMMNTAEGYRAYSAKLNIQI